MEYRYSDNDPSKRDIPSFIEPGLPFIKHPFMRPKPQKVTNLMYLLEDSECEEPELVQVYLRLKPCNVRNYLYEVRSDKCLITSVDTATVGHGRRTQHNVSKMYTFSHIFKPQCTQKEIFEQVVKSNLKKLSEGHSFTLLTYGASGSGKTYTLMGTVAAPGLVPRSLEYVFRVVDAAQKPLYKPGDGGEEKLSYAEQEHELQWVKRLRQVSAPLRDKYRRMSVRLHNDLTVSSMDLSNRVQHYVWVSFVEVYNEAIFDLLVNDRRSASKLRIREDANGNVYVKGATQAFVRTGEEAYDVLVAGKHNLQVAATGVHAQSSRSHCIFTITMLTETENGLRTSSVRLCDLAGSERAHRTRNTGVRMQESRAINTSLHVLERCLHMLRRNQRQRVDCNLVPYRESKLTRLLGAGLSGARGEAVSMVVTVNPSPDYAHETKHVLQLAAVAKDIQVNHTIAETIAESSLESTQDTTVEGSAEIMRLRADNERLHFELVQCESRNKELVVAVDERRQESARLMRELVKEAKDMTKEYYEAQIQDMEERHKSQMQDLVEEYEKKLSKPRDSSVGTGTSNIALQNKITHLMTEIAILEEKLNAERLARARVMEEVQHLRTCIEERDEIGSTEDVSVIEPKQKDVVVLTDSDSGSDNETDDIDIANESLEPTFKKEDINRSRLLRQSNNFKLTDEESSEENLDVLNNSSHNFEIKSYLDDKANGTYIKKNNESVCQNNDIHNHSDAFENDDKNDQHRREKDDHSLTSDEGCDLEKTEDSYENCYDTHSAAINEDNKTNENYETLNNDSVHNEVDDLMKYNKKKLELLQRGTYCINDAETSVTGIESDECKTKKSSTQLRETHFIANPKMCNVSNKTNDDTDEEFEGNSPNAKLNDNNVEIKLTMTETFVSKIITPVKSNSIIDNSLVQFEQIEMAAQEYKDASNDFELTKPFFDDDSKLKIGKEQKTYFDNIDVNINLNSTKNINEISKSNIEIDDLRSPLIHKDVPKDNIPTTIKKLLDETVTKKHDLISSVQKTKMLSTTHESIDMFEGLDSPHFLKDKVTTDDVDIIRKSIDNLTTNKQDLYVNNVKKSMVIYNMTSKQSDLEIIVSNESKEIQNEVTVLSETQKGNTIEDFENIYNEITIPSATEFELIVSQEKNASKLNETELKQDTVKPKTVAKSKYNLRRRNLSESEERIEDENDNDTVENRKPKKNLRLRRHKNQTEDIKPEDSVKLNDIVNLQKEYCDVTLDVPAVKKIVKDISSPERNDDENLAPLMEIQTCPSKSVTRSKRKLFTPRAEPLEESATQTGDSNERLCIPRPSYQRGRARRKL